MLRKNCHLTIQSIRKYCEGYSSSTGLTSIIESIFKSHHFNQLNLEFPDWSESSRMDSDVLDKDQVKKIFKICLKTTPAPRRRSQYLTRRFMLSEQMLLLAMALYFSIVSSHAQLLHQLTIDIEHINFTCLPGQACSPRCAQVTPALHSNNRVTGFSNQLTSEVDLRQAHF